MTNINFCSVIIIIHLSKLFILSLLSIHKSPPPPYIHTALPHLLRSCSTEMGSSKYSKLQLSLLPRTIRTPFCWPISSAGDPLPRESHYLTLGLHQEPLWPLLQSWSLKSVVEKHEKCACTERKRSQISLGSLRMYSSLWSRLKSGHSERCSDQTTKRPNANYFK